MSGADEYFHRNYAVQISINNNIIFIINLQMYGQIPGKVNLAYILRLKY